MNARACGRSSQTPPKHQPECWRAQSGSRFCRGNCGWTEVGCTTELLWQEFSQQSLEPGLKGGWVGPGWTRRGQDWGHTMPAVMLQASAHVGSGAESRPGGGTLQWCLSWLCGAKEPGNRPNHATLWTSLLRCNSLWWGCGQTRLGKATAPLAYICAGSSCRPNLA